MVTFVVLQFSIVSAVGKQYMSAVDWRSEEDYANFEKAETADIAWEWLRLAMANTKKTMEPLPFPRG